MPKWAAALLQGVGGVALAVGGARGAQTGNRPLARVRRERHCGVRPASIALLAGKASPARCQPDRGGNTDDRRGQRGMVDATKIAKLRAKAMSTGDGIGRLTRLLTATGASLVAVEPVDEMRAAPRRGSASGRGEGGYGGGDPSPSPPTAKVSGEGVRRSGRGAVVCYRHGLGDAVAAGLLRDELHLFVLRQPLEAVADRAGGAL